MLSLIIEKIPQKLIEKISPSNGFSGYVLRPKIGLTWKPILRAPSPKMITSICPIMRPLLYVPNRKRSFCLLFEFVPSVFEFVIWKANLERRWKGGENWGTRRGAQKTRYKVCFLFVQIQIQFAKANFKMKFSFKNKFLLDRFIYTFDWNSKNAAR